MKGLVFTLIIIPKDNHINQINKCDMYDTIFKHYNLCNNNIVVECRLHSFLITCSKEFGCTAHKILFYFHFQRFYIIRVSHFKYISKWRLWGTFAVNMTQICIPNPRLRCILSLQFIADRSKMTTAIAWDFEIFSSKYFFDYFVNFVKILAYKKWHIHFCIKYCNIRPN